MSVSEKLQPGLSLSFVLVIAAEHSPQHLLPTIVLSTPFMIQKMEEVCTMAVWNAVGEDKTTVGTHVDVYHRSAAREGEEVTFACELRSVEGRKLLFDVTVRAGERIVGEGIHERFVVDRDRFAG